MNKNKLKYQKCTAPKHKWQIAYALIEGGRWNHYGSGFGGGIGVINDVPVKMIVCVHCKLKKTAWKY